jgi:hypothetical protein
MSMPANKFSPEPMRIGRKARCSSSMSFAEILPNGRDTAADPYILLLRTLLPDESNVRPIFPTHNPTHKMRCLVRLTRCLAVPSLLSRSVTAEAARVRVPSSPPFIPKDLSRFQRNQRGSKRTRLRALFISCAPERGFTEVLKPPTSAFWRIVHIEWRVLHGGRACESLDYVHVQRESLLRFRCDIYEVPLLHGHGFSQI